MTTEINTHGLVCDFGKHKGLLYTRVPVGYLHWMVGNNHPKAEIASAELKRRGSVLPTLDISGHAIDRASLHCRKYWHQTRGENEGLHAWLCRISKEALANTPDPKGRYRYGDVLLAFEFEGNWPVLKTVIYKPQNEQPRGDKGEG